MSVIIRLQNLPWSANALDIRQFFHGLSIPEGGVHIVGGEQGDAFIAFSTDEDARQAFARNNGKIKEVQISLMLSSRTEMQKVIEAARAQSYAAFMQNPTPTVPMPAAVPAIIPAAVPELKKENSKDRDTKDKRDRKRSRSRSRDRKDRDRRDRRYRDRSRSRSRERRERRRRDRSRSRGRSRSKDRDRKNRDRKRSTENFNQKDGKKIPEVWANQNSNDSIPAAPLPPSLFGNYPGNLDDARRNLNALTGQANTNGRNNFPVGNFGMNRSRDSWPPQNTSNDNDQTNFLNRSDDSLSDSRQRPGPGQNFPNRRFTRNNNFPRAENDQQYPPAEREPLPDCCVRLQPFYGGYGDIRRFFQGSFISNVGIKFINDDFGHRTGIVYIQFGHPQGKLDALHKNGEILNGVKVEVVHIDDEEFDEAVDRYQPEVYQPNNENTKFRSKNITKYFNKAQEPELEVFSCLTVDDLPTYVKEQDILKLFSPRPLLALFLTPKPRGGHIAYVKFGSAEEAKKALEETSNHIVGSKSVTVKPCEDREFENISQQHNVDLDRKSSPVPQLDTDCINLTRLPLQTNNIEIADFFSDIGVRPTKIHLMSNRLGFTGQAFCEFKTKEDAAQALKKDNSSFGPNIVSVQPFPREEMEHILQQSPAPNVPLLQQPLMPRGPTMNQNRPFFPRNSYEGGPPRGGHRFMGHRAPRPRFMNAVVTDDAPPGCTVYMDNVPYKAGTNEILDFFDGYDITNNVSRRFNPNNTPSAEAKVIFNSPEEAYRAVQEKNGQKIWERPIYLKQV
ncbi:epithelial splicing regulatory protein 2 [Tribolium madens]|uniref:epithelial splicing regulatory protein 2 n=1 Tax=Tribolium madens TaxID=41895 RepID=UPI001CF744EE|nr:epithelial splicing regulatory protein 2 [Tribolium madens]